MESNICFEMSLIVIEAIRGHCASIMVLTATVSEIFGGQTSEVKSKTFIRQIHVGYIIIRHD